MDNISFTSGIKFVSSDLFNKRVQALNAKQFVGYPWTVRQSVISDSAYTRDVFDCSVCGLTDGEKVFMLHICPTKEENYDFSKIEEFIKSKIDLTAKSLQGLLLGSKNYGYMMSEKSWKLFDNFENLLKRYNIPYSKFRGGPDAHHVAYSSKTDEWIIAKLDFCFPTCKTSECKKIDLAKEFEECSISPLDELCLDIIQ